MARLKEGGGEQTRLEELMEVERELKQANKTIQQQVSHVLNKQNTIYVIDMQNIICSNIIITYTTIHLITYA